ncbi:MAG: MEKHLA domain-containing protein [bacterium]
MKSSPIDPRSHDLFHHIDLLLKSFKHWTGRDLLTPLPTLPQTAHARFEIPFIVLSHGAEQDPILNYGNRAALELWEMTWDSFIHTPSRLTAEPLSREARARFLTEVTQKGFIDNYGGVRISNTGKRFQIEGAVVWNIIDERGAYQGQAATFEKWFYL